MSSTVSANFSGAFQASCFAPGPLATLIGSNVQLQNLINIALSSGTGAGKTNQLFVGSFTLAASSTQDLDMYAYGGAKDAGGNAITMAVIRLLIVLNYGVSGATVEADTLLVGGKGATSGWTSWCDANTDKVTVFSGPATATNPTTTPGAFVLIDTGGTGYVVGNASTNHLLTFTTGANSGTIGYTVIAVGGTA